ncbi:MAG TPA: TolC family protein [Fibrobacteria bacterium]|nr:TolC family protein [Fibrobacteria bacterium]
MTRSVSISSLLLLALALGATASPSDTLRLSLEEAMETARHAGYAAQASASRSRESSARTAEARSALLPHIGATASDVVRSYNAATFGITFPGVSHVDAFQVQDARVGARMTVWDYSAWKRYRAAQRSEDKAGLDQKAGEEDAALAGAEAYLALLRARSLVRARGEEVALAEQLDTLTGAQKKAGSITQLEVLRARGQVASAHMALAAAIGEEASARYVLLQVLNQPLDLEIATKDTLSVSAIALDGSAGARGLDAGAQGRPDVAAAAAEADEAQAELEAARAGFFPTVEASGDYGLSGRRLYTGGAQWTEDAAVQLNWSLWDGGGRGARIRQREEKVRQATLKLNEARSRAGRDARLQNAMLAAASEEASRAADRAALAEEEARLATEKFRAGSSGNLDVISAQASVSAAHEAYVNSLYGYNRTRLEFLRAIHLL